MISQWQGLVKKSVLFGTKTVLSVPKSGTFQSKRYFSVSEQYRFCPGATLTVHGGKPVRQVQGESTCGGAYLVFNEQRQQQQGQYTVRIQENLQARVQVRWPGAI